MATDRFRKVNAGPARRETEHAIYRQRRHWLTWHFPLHGTPVQSKRILLFNVARVSYNDNVKGDNSIRTSHPVHWCHTTNLRTPNCTTDDYTEMKSAAEREGQKMSAMLSMSPHHGSTDEGCRFTAQHSSYACPSVAVMALLRSTGAFIDRRKPE